MKLRQLIDIFIRDKNNKIVVWQRPNAPIIGWLTCIMECLSLLSIRGMSSPTELAKYTGMTTRAATTMLDRLETVGFITRKPNPNDRRGVVVVVNAESTKKMGAVFAGAQVAQRSVIER